MWPYCTTGVLRLSTSARHTVIAASFDHSFVVRARRRLVGPRQRGETDGRTDGRADRRGRVVTTTQIPDIYIYILIYTVIYAVSSLDDLPLNPLD